MEILEKGIEMYLSGFGNVKKIKKELNIKDNSLDEELRKRGYFICGGITLKSVIGHKKAYDEYTECLNKGEEPSLTKISKKYGISRDRFAARLKKAGIEVVNYQNTPKFNYEIFDNIDSEEKAYWLGFIFADGYVSEKGYHFEISLKLEDKEHLEKFNKFIGCSIEGKVKIGDSICNGKSFKRCRWSCVNKHLHSSLVELGCIPKKSLILKFPDISLFKSKDLIRHFIRGYFDGDGCISYRTKQHDHMMAVVLGTSEFLNEMQKYLPFNAIRKLQYNDKSKSEITRTLNYYGESGLKFIDFLYQNSTIFLNRKYERYLEYCRLYKKL
jgi:hypothetical protein